MIFLEEQNGNTKRRSMTGRLLYYHRWGKGVAFNKKGAAQKTGRLLFRDCETRGK